MIEEKKVLEALGTIIDPDFRKDIVSLGFIKNMKIEGDHVAFDIELTTAACPVKVEFQKQAEEAVRRVAGVKSVNANMTSKPRKAANTSQTPGLAKVKNIIAVASAKGGVGKSTVAANIARELSHRGLATGLLDADIFGPSIPTLFDIHRPSLYQDEDNLIVPLEVPGLGADGSKTQGLKLMSFGFLLPEGPAILRGPLVSQYIQQLLGQVKWGELDYLVIDMPPGTGDVQLTITQTIRISGAVIVTTRQALSLVDVERGIEMFEKVKVPMLGIVENMSYFVCDNCDKKHYLFGPAGSTSLTEKYGLESLVQIPINQDIVSGLNKPAANPFIVELVDNMIRAEGKRSIEDKSLPTVANGPAGLSVSWTDGTKAFVPHRELRADCHCATCVDEHSGERLLKEEDIPDDIAAVEVEPLGNYALRISWSDGHNTGIYPWAQIRKWAEVGQATAR
ncbi:MAG TPA: P-loop NTPase [Rectinemataceae bacterium]|nr:P-loop NTPase [Rectinemataceae bacterium]